MTYKIFSLIIFGLVIFSTVSFAQDSQVDPFFLTGSRYSGPVKDAVLQFDGKLIIAGEFETIGGVRRSRVARLKSNGDLDETFNPGTGANRDIFAVALQSDGKIIIGGDFTIFNGVETNRVARLNTDGSLDTTFNIGSGASFTVQDIAVSNTDKPIIVGKFNLFNNSPFKRIIRLNQDGSPDSTFSPGDGANNIINSVAVRPDGKIIIGGSFTRFDNVSLNRLARLNSNGSVDTSFTPPDDFGVLNNIALQSDGLALVSTESGKIRRIQPNGSLDTTFNVDDSQIVSITSIDVTLNNKIYIGGSFRPDNANTANRTLMRLNSDGTQDSSFARNEHNPVYKVLAQANNNVIVGGRLGQYDDTVGGPDITGLKRFNADGSFDAKYITRIGAANFDLFDIQLQTDGKMVVHSHEFGLVVGGLATSGIARLLPDGRVDEQFRPTVHATAITTYPGGKIIAGGVASDRNDVFRFHRLNNDGSIDDTFQAESSGEFRSTNEFQVAEIITQPDGKIIAVGNFQFINELERKAIVRLNSDGSIDTTFNPNLTLSTAYFNNVVLQPDGKILVAGSFNNSQTIFRLNPDGTMDGLFSNAVPDRLFREIALQMDGKILVSGFFTQINGVPIKSVARLNSNGSLDSTFAPPQFKSETGFQNPPFIKTVFPLQSGKLLVSGSFVTADGIHRFGLSRLNQDGSLDTSFNLNLSFNDEVHKFTQQSDGKILIVGGFYGIGGFERQNIARLIDVDKSSNSRFDFDGDGKTDIGIFRPLKGEWWYLRSSDGSSRAIQFGSPTDKIVPADYTGDGKTDVAFFRPSSGEWFVLRCEDGTFYSFPFGTSGDIPAPGDFDGDGKADPAVFRPSTATWYILKSTGGTSIQQFGVAEDIPQVNDYDGDGKADLAVFRPTPSEWWVTLSSSNSVRAFQFGASGDKPIPADYTGDGKTDVAIWRPATGNWFVLRSEDNSFYSFPFGISTDQPAAGDYDGDGKTDAAVFRNGNQTWYLNQSSNGAAAIGFGTSGDKPIPSAFVP